MTTKLRSINTHFWDDSFIVELDPIEKLLFLYLLTNSLTNIAGAYEIPIRKIAFDTGIDRDTVVRLLRRFEEADKLVYQEGWVLMRNFMKNQKLNPNMKLGAKAILDDAPPWINETLSKGSKGFESLRNPMLKYEVEVEVEGEVEVECEAHTANPSEPFAMWDYPMKQLVEAFPDYLPDRLTPSMIGFIEGDVKLGDEIAWGFTIRDYQQNFNPMLNRYLPDKVGNLLNVFRNHKERLEKEKNGTSQKPVRRTNIDKLRATAQFIDNQFLSEEELALERESASDGQRSQ